MELTSGELSYVFNCISCHNVNVLKDFETLKSRISKRPEIAVCLIPDIGRIINDLERSFDLMYRINEQLEDSDDYQEVRKELTERKEWVVELRQCFDEMKEALGNPRDE